MRRTPRALLATLAEPPALRRLLLLLVALPLLPPGGPAMAEPVRAPLDTLADLQRALRACWVPPPPEAARPGMQITVRTSFKRDGTILGKPRITFEAPGATDDDRLAYRIAVAAMLTRCTPLPFTDALGAAVAGRPFSLRLIDRRGVRGPRRTSL
ncbi:hypothetical protein [Rhodovulum sp. PH10]|uniref:hypothetical protein n=1 Tax=Rhodovulum sp. PH10 TaxID=1187851 RepID=UPI0006911D7B|nr:hypothetical protein [Rhodovulum sp. PH10]